MRNIMTRRSSTCRARPASRARATPLLLYQKHYGGAGQHLRPALDFARSYKVRRLEALAGAALGSLLSSKNQEAEALPLATQALDFYVRGNSRKEADQTRRLVGRIKRQ